MPTPQLILALDQGTTSSRTILFDTEGRQIATAQKELRQIYPGPANSGWVEHDPLDIWNTQLQTAQDVIAQSHTNPAHIAAIGITNQRETTLLWDRSTGQPLHNAIVWQDRRTADFCSQLKSTHAQIIQQKTGLIPDAYFSASKLKWLLDHIPNARTRAEKGELAFGTVDTWLLYNLTRNPTQSSALSPHHSTHATDLSNASRTMLFNIHTCDWDDDLLTLFQIPQQLLPQVQDSASHFGTTNLFGPVIPITGIAGDQQAALFGQNCTTPGLAKNTYGTGCFLLSNTGTTPTSSKHNLLTTIAWRCNAGILPASPRPSNTGVLPAIPQNPNLNPNPNLISPANTPQSTIENPKSKIKNPPTYALEGSVFVGGAVVQWLRDGLGLIKSAADIEPLAKSVPDSGGLYLVPAFAGLGAPHWDQYARGSISGITRATTAAHFARAALESIAFQVADLLDVINADSPTPVRELRGDGGASKNDLLLQFQSDLLHIPIHRPTITETTALGAAFLAGLGAGIWQSPEDLKRIWKIEKEFSPKMSRDESHHRRTRWSAALKRSLDWETHPD